MNFEPILITIGPQCCGKTTYLKMIDDIVDIAIDDSPGTYEKINIDEIINYDGTKHVNENSSLLNFYFGVSLIDRIIDENTKEQLLILFLFREVIVLCVEYFFIILIQELSLSDFCQMFTDFHHPSEIENLVIRSVSQLYLSEMKMV